MDAISCVALLFQSGYLTIQQVEEFAQGLRLFTLTYPNFEVQTALNESLLPALGAASNVALLSGIAVLKALRSADFNNLKTQLQSLYASIPHDWHRNNAIANYEGHYASVFYSFLWPWG